jgi:hypothetical protein
MRTRVLTFTYCLVLGSLPVAAQQPAKPGPEQEVLKKFEGNWDATVAFSGQEAKGQSVYKLGFGGLWLTQDFQGDFGGMKFEGRGTTGYDPIKKKYVGTWIDSMSPSLAIMEGEFSKDGKTYTETGEGPGPDGKPAKMKNVCEFKDNNTMVFTMYMVNDGKEQEAMKITYKKK